MKNLIIILLLCIFFSCIESTNEIEKHEKKEEKKPDSIPLYIENISGWECISVIPFSKDYGNAKNGIINNSTSTLTEAEMSYRNFLNDPLTLSVTTPNDGSYYYCIGTILTFWNGIEFCWGHYTYHLKGKINNSINFYVSDSYSISLKAQKIIHYTGVVNSIAIFNANEKIDIDIYTTNLQLSVINPTKWSNKDSGVNSDLQLGLYRIKK